MDLVSTAATAESFLRAWLAEHHPPTEDPDDFTTTVQRVEPDGDDGLLFTFALSIPFRLGDMRPQRRIDAALRALSKAHPALDVLRFEVTATTHAL